MSDIQNKEKWLNLYETAKRYQQLAPWEWMGDAQVFGVEHPETKELVFCVVFGRGGEVFGLNAYKGITGLESYLSIMNLSPYDNPLFTQDTIGLAFEDRSDLTKEDYKHLKNLGLKFRGKKNWIQFLDYTPGYHPWIITEEQVDLMEVVIEQTMEVAQLLKDDPNLIVDDYVMINHTNDILIRRQVEGKWRNTFIDPERLLNMEEEEDLFFPEQLITYLKDFKQRLPVKDYTLINGFEFISSPIQDDKSQRPYYPRLAFWIDPESEAILTQEMGKEADGIKIIYQPLLGLVDAYKKIPAQIIVSDSLAYDYLYILEEFWGIDIVYDPSDMTAKSIVSQLMSFLG